LCKYDSNVVEAGKKKKKEMYSINKLKNKINSLYKIILKDIMVSNVICTCPYSVLG